MPTNVLHRLTLPEDAQTKSSGQQNRKVAQQGTIGSGVGNAESISATPGDRLLTGWFRGVRSQDLAQEFEELFGNSDFGAVSYFALDPDTNDPVDIPERGYYELQDVNTQKSDPRTKYAHKFDGSLIKKGSRQSHWRTVNTEVDASVTNPVGSTSTPLIAAPATADKVRWFDPPTGQREVASTSPASPGVSERDPTMAIYDPSASSFTDPQLNYEVPYDEETIDVILWDGKNDGKYDSNGDMVWQRVYDVKHAFYGSPVTDNGRVTVRFNIENQSFGVFEWVSGSWESVSTGSSSWILYDAEVSRITPVEVYLQCEFYDPNTDNLHTLDCYVHRGIKWPQFLEPDNATNQASNAPQGLVDYLSPIASERDVKPNPVKTIFPKEETRL